MPDHEWDGRISKYHDTPPARPGFPADYSRADLTLDTAVLDSVYLGGYGPRRLTAAGLVDEHSRGAVTRADAMFRSPVTRWCSTWF